MQRQSCQSQSDATTHNITKWMESLAKEKKKLAGHESVTLFTTLAKAAYDGSLSVSSILALEH